MPTNAAKPERKFRRSAILKIDGYIIQEILGPFFGGAAFFTFVFLMFQVLRLAEFFIVHNIPGNLIVKMGLLLTLSFLPMALPVAFLIAVLVGFGRLSSDSELVALKSMGIGLRRMSAPALLVSSFVVALSLGLNLEWVPWGERTFKSTLIKVSNTKAVSALNEGTFTSGFFDLLIYADRVDTKTNRMKKVFIYDERDAKNPLTVVAAEGQILPIRNESSLGSEVILELYNGDIHRSDLSTNAYQKINFQEYRIYLKVTEGDDTSVVKAKTLPIHEIRSELAKNPPGSHRHTEISTELWRRVSLALSPLAFVLLGMGFGTVRTRSVRAGATLVALIVLVSYWVMQISATSLAHRGFIPPPLAMQIPNIVTFVAGFWAFRRSSW